jgi:polyisoprenoid-binding protein YceI
MKSANNGMRVWLVAVTSLLLHLFPSSGANAARFEFKPGDDKNVVRFDSKAPMESFSGETNQLSGYISLEPAGLGDSITVRVEVDLASLDTGIDRRNRHMRENHLETDKYPRAVFTGATVVSPAAARLRAGQVLNCELEGTFDLHGVSRRIRVMIEATYLTEGGVSSIHVVTSFRVALPDYEISRPKFLFLKLEETQTVTFDAVAVEVK